MFLFSPLSFRSFEENIAVECLHNLNYGQMALFTAVQGMIAFRAWFRVAVKAYSKGSCLTEGNLRITVR